MDESRFSLNRADGRQRVWRHVGEPFTDVNVVDQVAHDGGEVMVWACVCYGQRTQVHYIDGILNEQRYRDEIIHDHHLARPHVLQQTVAFKQCSIATKGPNVCQEKIPPTITPPPTA